MVHCLVTATRTTRLMIAALAASTGLNACGGSATVTAPSESAARCQPSLTAPAQSFNSGGGTGTVAVSISRECSWSAGADASWIVITGGAQGQGDGTVAFRVVQNTVTSSRVGGIAVADQRVTMTQQAAPPPPPPPPPP